MLELIEVPYRVIDVAAGDLGSSAARKYDCEAWFPFQGRYREVTSTSKTTDFQAAARILTGKQVKIETFIVPATVEVDADLDRWEKLRVEIMEGGFFHAPGYETGRPQKDIKFLRDLAHVTVFRLCGYSGPFYGSEYFAVREA